MGFVIKDKTKLWSDGIIPFAFKYPDQNKEKEKYDSLVELDIENVILACMARWEEFVNSDGVQYIKFKKRTDEKEYKLIDLSKHDSGSGAGGIGKVTDSALYIGYKQPLVNAKSIPHELGHVLGLGHEDNRAAFYKKGHEWDGQSPPMMCCAANQSGQATLNVLSFTTVKYRTVGVYDIWSIMHYPLDSNFEWNCSKKELEDYAAAHQDAVFKTPEGSVPVEEWKNDGVMISWFNYPTWDEVKIGRWSPSSGDIATIRDAYAKAK